MNIIEVTNQQYLEKNAFVLPAIRAGMSLMRPLASRAVGAIRPLATRARDYTKTEAFKTGLKTRAGGVVDNLATSAVTNTASQLVKTNPPPAIKPMGINNPTFKQDSVFNRGSFR